MKGNNFTYVRFNTLPSCIEIHGCIPYQCIVFIILIFRSNMRIKFRIGVNKNRDLNFTFQFAK